MKKRFAGICLLVLCLVGCQYGKERQEIFTDITEDKPSTVSSNLLVKAPVDREYAKEEIPVLEKVIDESVTTTSAATTEETRAREEIGMSDATIRTFISSQIGNYYFDSLSKDDRVLYAEIYMILVNNAKDIVVSSKDTNQIDFVFQCVLADHPEIFHVQGYAYTKHTINDELNRITFTGTYLYSTEEVASRKVQMEQYVNTCINGIPTGSSSYEKVKYIYEYLIAHTNYNLEAPDNQNICSVFIYGESVCQGYAKATQYLLNRLGVTTTLVTGYVINSGEGHAWNLVNIDKAYYYVDTTWGDAFYTLEDSNGTNVSGSTPTINYDYLCVTTNQLCKTHVIDNLITMPYCNLMDANYYVREGCYFTWADEEKIKQLFSNAYAKGQPYVTLKCESDEVYRGLEKLLITDTKIFSYLQNSNSVSYTSSLEQLSFSFWL
ncbi:MAG TPA: transglutaminase domain-containing protein [Lachnospiraceae bacterium]|nr:transglutaminase domain-containing protein [Lachnospiraceae bacterium]